jgi:hypothetical protein
MINISDLKNTGQGIINRYYAKKVSILKKIPEQNG